MAALPYSLSEKQHVFFVSEDSNPHSYLQTLKYAYSNETEWQNKRNQGFDWIESTHQREFIAKQIQQSLLFTNRIKNKLELNTKHLHRCLNLQSIVKSINE